MRMLLQPQELLTQATGDPQNLEELQLGRCKNTRLVNCSNLTHL